MSQPMKTIVCKNNEWMEIELTIREKAPHLFYGEQPVYFELIDGHMYFKISDELYKVGEVYHFGDAAVQWWTDVINLRLKTIRREKRKKK